MQETQETWVQSLGQEDPLEKEMATHYSILAWEIPWTEEPRELQSIGLQKQGRKKSDMTEHTLWGGVLIVMGCWGNLKRYASFKKLWKYN